MPSKFPLEHTKTILYVRWSNYSVGSKSCLFYRYPGIDPWISLSLNMRVLFSLQVCVNAPSLCMQLSSSCLCEPQPPWVG